MSAQPLCVSRAFVALRPSTSNLRKFECILLRLSAITNPCCFAIRMNRGLATPVNAVEYIKPKYCDEIKIQRHLAHLALGCKIEIL
jgi:hypothetical protein